MAKGKSEFVVGFNADEYIINQTILNWLNMNKFKPKEKNGVKFYQSGDGIWTTANCFEYYIKGNQVIIKAFQGSVKNPYTIDVKTAAAKNYVNLIKQLTNAINNISGPGLATGRNFYEQEQQMVAVTNAMQVENDKNDRTSAYIALGVSMLNVIILFVGYIYFWLVIVAYLFGAQGIKAKEKLIAISALVINTVVLIAFILLKTGVIFL